MSLPLANSRRKTKQGLETRIKAAAYYLAMHLARRTQPYVKLGNPH